MEAIVERIVAAMVFALTGSGPCRPPAGAGKAGTGVGAGVGMPIGGVGVGAGGSGETVGTGAVTPPGPPGTWPRAAAGTSARPTVRMEVMAVR